MTTYDQLKARRAEIARLAETFGAANVRVFGSVVRGQDRADSDIDFLVEMDADRSLLDRIALMQALEDLLKRKVDVVNERALHPDIRDNVLHEAVAL